MHKAWTKSESRIGWRDLKWSLMQVFFVECVDLFSEVWPSERPCEFFLQLTLVTASPFLGEFDFPTTKVV